MAGIYIHIPFCKQACYYCNFHFSTSILKKDEMIASLIREIEIRSSSSETEIVILSPDEMIETIYFGGGTPSILSANEIHSIISAIRRHFSISGNPEVTLEANPDDITPEKLNEWRKAGVNRLSIGIQSFIERDLKWMNRAHDARQALNCINLARSAGFQNFSIDLIFGTPRLTEVEWEKNINIVIDLNVPHIACYALTVEPKTILNKMILAHKKENIDTDAQAEQYSALMKLMYRAGYEHYEISNFAKPGFRSRHNSSYWQGKKYIGIGPSAHSYNGKMRLWNKANNALYIKSITENEIPFEKENLTQSQMLNEYIMTSLRTIEGMDLDYIEKYFSKQHSERIETIIKNEVEKDMILLKGNKIMLTDEGKLFADRIAVKLFE
ncbi:MAG TPA: radical SAM family heme chaperone HemW [Hanamia sp.]